MILINPLALMRRFFIDLLSWKFSIFMVLKKAPYCFHYKAKDDEQFPYFKI
jgi:hypothetical protein